MDNNKRRNQMTVKKTIKLPESITEFQPHGEDSLAITALTLKSIIENLVSAHNALEGLKQIHAERKEWARVGDLSHFASELSEYISCDHGEAGMIPYIEDLFKVVRKA
jgi:hypothetical protein